MTSAMNAVANPTGVRWKPQTHQRREYRISYSSVGHLTGVSGAVWNEPHGASNL